MPHATLRFVLLASALVVNRAPHAAAASFLVDRTDDVSGTLCTAVSADCSLRGAIQLANALFGADEVQVPAGTYLLTLGLLGIDDDLALVGSGADATVLDGGASTSSPGCAPGLFGTRVISVQGGFVPPVVTIADLTVRGGSGGGIRNSGNLSLNRVVLTDNCAIEGGGVSNIGGTLTVTDSTFQGNAARLGPLLDLNLGGGLYTAGVAVLANVTLSGNSADQGGAIYTEGPQFSLSLENVTATGNAAAEGCTLRSNGELSITSSTLGPCTQGLHVIDHRGTVAGSGGTVTNTIVAGGCFNSASGEGEPLRSGGGNLDRLAECGFDDPTDLANRDPALGPLADNGGLTLTHEPLPGSPVIDAGVDADCPATDQRGEARPFDGDGDGEAHCDIGAVEFVPEPAAGLLVGVALSVLSVLARRRRSHAGA